MIISGPTLNNPFAVETNVEQGSTAEVSLEKGKIVGTHVPEPNHTLDELLAKVTKTMFTKNPTRASGSAGRLGKRYMFPKVEQLGSVFITNGKRSK